MSFILYNKPGVKHGMRTVSVVSVCFKEGKITKISNTKNDYISKVIRDCSPQNDKVVGKRKTNKRIR